MIKSTSQRVRKIVIVLLYGSYLLLSLWVLYREIPNPALERWAASFLFFTTLFLVYIYLQSLKGTGVWDMIFVKEEKLDERQLLISNNAFRRSYAIILAVFSGLCAYIMMGDPNWIVQHLEFIKIVFVSLFFLGVSLPVAILAWTEEEI